MKNVKKKNIGIGYKVFNYDWKCRDFQYQIGHEYFHEGEIKMCSSGFHFCPTLIDCFNYYEWNPENKVAIVHYDKTKTIGPEGSNKYVTSHIRIEKEIEWNDIMRMCNMGIYNTGHHNTGDGNTGHWNTGHWNTGDGNTGHHNTGHWNTGDWNTGFFNTITPDEILIFNKICKRSDWERCEKPDFIYFPVTELVILSNMTEQEKSEHPESKITGGYLRTMGYKEAFQKSYNEADEEDRKKIENLPNFNANIFYEISGIKLKKIGKRK